MNIELFALGDAARMLVVKPHRILYLLSSGAVAEPAMRVAGKRLWNHAEIAALSETLKLRSAAKLERERTRHDG